MNEQIVTTAAHKWDSSTTAGKIWLVALLMTAVGIGFFSANYLNEAKLERLEAKYERELTALQSQSKMQVATKENSTENIKPPQSPPRLGEEFHFASITAIHQEGDHKQTEHARSGKTTLESLADEVATFRFAVENLSNEKIEVSSAELLVDKVQHTKYRVVAIADPPLLDHTGHIVVALDSPTVGESIPVPLMLSVEPGKAREFSVWFRSPESKKRGEILCVAGRLRLISNKGAIYSSQIDVVIHSDETRNRPTSVPPKAPSGPLKAILGPFTMDKGLGTRPASQ
jgi:hypothetical protein